MKETLFDVCGNMKKLVIRVFTIITRLHGLCNRQLKEVWNI